MAAREAYVRAVWTSDRCEMIAGLEIRINDDLDAIRCRLRALMCESWAQLPELRTSAQDYQLAEEVEMRIRLAWPLRAYFIEVGIDADREGWVQVYQPWRTR